MSQLLRIRYAGAADWHTAAYVHTWHRHDRELEHGVDKDTIRSRIAILFTQSPADAVTMLVLNRTPFLIVHVGSASFDLSSPEPRQVELQGITP